MCSWHVCLPSSVPTCQSYNMKMATQNSISLILLNITCWVFRWLGLWACAWEHVKPLGISSFEICTRELRIAVSGFVVHAIMVSLVLYQVIKGFFPVPDWPAVEVVPFEGLLRSTINRTWASDWSFRCNVWWPPTLVLWTLAETAAFWGDCLSDRPALWRGKASLSIFPRGNQAKNGIRICIHVNSRSMGHAIAADVLLLH